MHGRIRIVKDDLAIQKKLGAINRVCVTLVTPVSTDSKLRIVEHKEAVAAWWRGLIAAYSRSNIEKLRNMNGAKRSGTLTDIFSSPKIKNRGLGLGDSGLQWFSAALGTSDNTRQNILRDRDTVIGEVRVSDTRNPKKQKYLIQRTHGFTPTIDCLTNSVETSIAHRA
jgi:hypothetical protein